MKPLIYSLSDPRDGSVRYVGYTRNFANRIHYHYRDRRYSIKKKLQCLAQPWIFELANLGLMPISKPLEFLDSDSDWQERERYWISHFRKIGEPILNGTNGGYGSLKGRIKLTLQQRQNISIRNKQAWLNKTPEQKEEVKLLLAKYHRSWSYRWEKRDKSQGQLASEKRWSNPERRKQHCERMKLQWKQWRKEKGHTGTWDERRKLGLLSS